MVERFLTSDRVFGYMAPFVMSEFFDAGRLASLREQIRKSTLRGPVAIVGVGAAIVAPGDVLVIADMPRWELQLRYRRGAPNWTIENPDEDFLRKYKRGYFVEWRTADRHKLSLLDRADFFLDTTIPMDPRLVTGATYRSALKGVTGGPFRVVPFFDPGVWGGQWMRRQFDLPDEPANFAWGFDCVPEENSILFNFGGIELSRPQSISYSDIPSRYWANGFIRALAPNFLFVSTSWTPLRVATCPCKSTQRLTTSGKRSA